MVTHSPFGLEPEKPVTHVIDRRILAAGGGCR